MSFSAKIKATAALFVAAGTCAMAATSPSGKVIDRLGDAKFQKSTNIGEWNDANVGIRIKEKDQIRTGIESWVVMALPDGSTITVQEISHVEFTTLQTEKEAQTVLTDVKTGKVKFNAQKQRSGGSFKFKTTTAIAAIRGTSGIFGQTPKATFMALANGNALLQTPKGLECEVNGGQTVYIRPDSKTCNTVNAKSSGSDEFQKILEQLIEDPNKSDEQVIKEAQQADSKIQDEIEKYKDKLKCVFDSLKDTITANYVTIKGSCNKGVSLSLAGKTFKDARKFEYTADWEPGVSGAKKFPATCSMDIPAECPKKDKANKACTKSISTDCGLLTTYYEANEALGDSNLIVITNPAPVDVCEPGAVTIEGKFDPTDPEGTLFVKVGDNKSKNLVPLSANGEFDHTVSISDVHHNWNAKDVIVEYQGKNGKQTKKVALNINKTCPQVNQLPPTLSLIHSDSLKCEALFSLVDANDDLIHISTEVDDVTTKEHSFTQDASFKVKLKPGVHNYALLAKDQAGNSSTLKKTLGCYPKNKPTITISGGNHESLRVPPPPPKAQSIFLYKTLRFKISNVVQQDPIHIEHIRVSLEDATLLDIRNSQITELDYSIPLELPYGKSSRVKIFVEMKNGRKATAIKTYEIP